jgi:MurNAc alpha-1-phosphate uridylyltransferase
MNNITPLPVTPLILAAGFGKRLGPITATTPKPLVDIGGVRLIETTLELLKRSGFNNAVINLHYLGQEIVNFLGTSWNGIALEYSWEDPILETGGAIKKVLSGHPDKPILVINSDAVFERSLSVRDFVVDFLGDPHSPTAKMLLVPPPSPNPYGKIFAGTYDGKLRVTQILDARAPIVPPQNEREFVFSGLQILAPRVIEDMIPLGDIFCSMRAFYPILLKRGDLITAEVFHGFWNDTGTPERLEETKLAKREGRV